jgi:hypothetical protein
VDDWEQIRLIGKALVRWVFRGQNVAEWLLKSSIERTLEIRSIPIELSYKYIIEEEMISDFKVYAKLFSDDIPSAENLVSWLILFRHYGGATRILDFTESFYVAAHFALYGAREDCAIWAVDRKEFIKNADLLVNKLSKKYQLDFEILREKIFDEIVKKAIRGEIRENEIIIMSSNERNRRQFLQQGVAMIPLNLKGGFMESLFGSFNPVAIWPDENKMNQISINEMFDIINNSKIIKIIMTRESFLEARLDLEKMNINSSSLFGGLEGLAKKSDDFLNRFERYINEKD